MAGKGKQIGISTLVVVVCLVIFFVVQMASVQPSSTPSTVVDADTGATAQSAAAIDEAGTYTDRDSVALYLHTYDHLPDNYITKNEARDAGWNAEKGNLDKVCPGKSIGGDRFGNNEGLLPDAAGRSWRECDIDYSHGTRNAKRIVYSSDGLIYYSDDHYNAFTRLY